MKTLQNIASVLVLSGGAALFGAGCVGQADDGMNDESEQALVADSANQDAIQAADEKTDVAANDEQTGESHDQFWGRGFGWRGFGFGGWRGIHGFGGLWGGYGLGLGIGYPYLGLGIGYPYAAGCGLGYGYGLGLGYPYGIGAACL
ncbi:MAG: hypothetical protein QM820_14230 [Minicystis sp.]